ncbi:MAG: tetratricopeptide repeat protein, partial [Calditrichia bacterium]
MADIGLNQNISIKERRFHIQTATHIEEGLIRTEVFEEGRLLFSQNLAYERRSNSQNGGYEERIRKVLSRCHQVVISEMKTLFDLSALLREKEDASSHFRLGAIFLSLHLYDLAEQHLRRAIELEPGKYSAHVTLARTLFFQNRFHASFDILEPLLAGDIAYPDLYNLLGMILLEQKNFIQALNHFRQAVKMNPDYKEAFFNLVYAV